ncbi:putative lysyl-trna synthetase protein [Neofusicoccum parvum UCRNP2]|uniref:Lysine--tRNA ligase n=1 Tax=Botryosphaeria parva (strain UCR-NP2) TaxID=1287680 RepID=R1G8S1_BOTPV|nr:putative lysyl-trna synthetase protein [Neofusicoccum parvum UCRNP2]
MSSSCRLLRPYLRRTLQRSVKPEQARAYLSFQRRFAQTTSKSPDATNVTHDYEKRVKQLEQAGDLAAYYPLNPHKADRTSVRRVHEVFARLKNDEVRTDVTVTVLGRVTSRRSSGSKLVFVDIYDRGHTIQGLCNFGVLEKHGVPKADFTRFSKLARKGDIFAVTGHPTRTTTGELSILATEVPTCLAPSLHQIPDDVENPETLARQPHVDFLVHQRRAATQRIRSSIIGSLRKFFDGDGFLEVSTPILTAGAGGASARPFETSANEFPDDPLTLRIAPELFLKRLVIGSGERVYEIGTVFRNEGIDATHNPEFTICEFYEPYAILEDLIQRTENLFTVLKTTAEKIAEENSIVRNNTTLPAVNLQAPFKRLEFVPTIEKAIGRRLPDLKTPTAFEDVVALFNELELPLPEDATLPRLLDELAAQYIEPLCIEPTFIMYHPEVMSPLAKHFTDQSTGQVLSRRVELFIQGREYVNAYEEENSPFEQRRKFEQQQLHRDPVEKVLTDRGVDESYIEALEWGLPPTGGWGCGIDRIVMLFSGTSRIADVQPFGTLKNVVALGKGRVGQS